MSIEPGKALPGWPARGWGSGTAELFQIGQLLVDAPRKARTLHFSRQQKIDREQTHNLLGILVLALLCEPDAPIGLFFKQTDNHSHGTPPAGKEWPNDVGHVKTATSAPPSCTCWPMR
jgi:hypothetical protein